MNLEPYLKDLFDLLSIPSISAQSSHKKDIVKAANWLQKKLGSIGFKSEVLPTNGHPVVYAEKLVPSTKSRVPNILIYGHYDVQSPDPLDEWSSNPFKAEVRNGNIYARGVADDKGQLYTWIAALSELKKEGKWPKANIKFLIEGEEEVGSLNLAEFIKDNKSLIKSDICVISDSHCLSKTQPLIEYGLRGLVYVEMAVKTAPKDVHSGIYGGNILNPINILSTIISRLKNEKHEILIPGFYDNVRKLKKNERKQLSKIPFTDKEVLSETGVDVVAGENGFTVTERAGARPTLDVNGIWGGYTREGPKTIIPGEAHTKISMRLVPNQKVSEIYEKLKSFIEKITPKGVELKIKLTSAAEPVLLDVKSVYFKKANSAYKKVFGKTPIYSLSGGTIGVVGDLKNILGMDSILMGYGLPNDGLHSPNEKLSLSMFKKGIKTNMEFLTSF